MFFRLRARKRHFSERSVRLLISACLRPSFLAVPSEASVFVSDISTLYCEHPETAEELRELAEGLGLDVDVQLSASPLESAEAQMGEEHRIGLVVENASFADLVRFAALAHAKRSFVALCWLGGQEEAPVEFALALGICAFSEPRPMLSALALHHAGLRPPFVLNPRALGPGDRARPSLPASRGRERRQGRLERRGRLLLWSQNETQHPLGELPDLLLALRGSEEARGGRLLAMPKVADVDSQLVGEVLFGPARELSDPTSKTALEHYDLPVPPEELCTSPSRAASEASRLGYPVRVALASPDLRIWDHPDLAADGIDSATAVREVFRQIVALAKTRSPEARVLGVVVSATFPASALLRLTLTPIDAQQSVLLHLGFADAHGRASRDAICLPLPLSEERLEAMLRRLRAHDLLLGGPQALRQSRLSALHDTLLRLAAFTYDWRREVVSVHIDPLAILYDGRNEIREVSVRISDAFERLLAQG